MYRWHDDCNEYLPNGEADAKTWKSDGMGCYRIQHGTVGRSVDMRVNPTEPDGGLESIPLSPVPGMVDLTPLRVSICTCSDGMDGNCHTSVKSSGR